MTFNISDPDPTGYYLYLEHLSSGDVAAPYQGFSPVNILVNDIGSNPFVWMYSPGSGGMTVNKFRIDNQLQNATNTIKVQLNGAYTHNWVKNAIVVQE